MAIGLGYFITFIGVVVAYVCSEGKSNKRKKQIWGIALMIPISPAFAFAGALTYATIVHDPWATLLMLYIFPVIFVTGLILLLVGVFKKEETSHL